MVTEKINQQLAIDIYPLPRLEELVESAVGNKLYATIDMKDAYHQVMPDGDGHDVTTISEGVTLCRFRRLPFGVSYSPAILSRQMPHVLTPLIKEGWVKNY